MRSPGGSRAVPTDSLHPEAWYEMHFVYMLYTFLHNFVYTLYTF